MKVGVLSDTHVHDYSVELERICDRYFKDVELILHAGDIVDLRALDSLLPRKVEAVAGNMDPLEVRERFPIKKVIAVEGFRVGIIHGSGSGRGIENRISAEFSAVDCIVYGHTHHPVNHVKDRVLFFNPGSATEHSYTSVNSIGILEFGETIVGHIIHL